MDTPTHTATSNNVHELDANTLRPFIDAHEVVLLAVLMLPQSEGSRGFVGVLRWVSVSISIPVSISLSVYSLICCVVCYVWKGCALIHAVCGARLPTP